MSTVTASLTKRLETECLQHVGKAPQKLAPLRAPGRKPSVCGLAWHKRNQVLSLLRIFLEQHPCENWQLRQPKRCNAALPPVKTQKRPSFEAVNVGPVNTQRPSFEAVLRVYYKGVTGKEMELMLECATNALEEYKRRNWIAKCRKNATEQIRLAFMAGDANCDGKLSIDEFVSALAVHRGGDQDDGNLARIFEEPDANGDGSVDLAEFLEIVSRNPELRASFDHVLQLGCTKRMQLEDHRSAVVFRQPISPNSHTVISPSGRRRRPGLFDLKSVSDICAMDRARNIRQGAVLSGA